MAWDLWIDFQRGDDDGLTYGNVRNLRAGLAVQVGDKIVVGNEDAEPGVAEVVEVGDNGFLLVRVFPGSVDEHRNGLRSGGPSGS